MTDNTKALEAFDRLMYWDTPEPLTVTETAHLIEVVKHALQRPLNPVGSDVTLEGRRDKL